MRPARVVLTERVIGPACSIASTMPTDALALDSGRDADSARTLAVVRPRARNLL